MSVDEGNAVAVAPTVGEKVAVTTAEISFVGDGVINADGIVAVTVLAGTSVTWGIDVDAVFVFGIVAVGTIGVNVVVFVLAIVAVGAIGVNVNVCVRVDVAVGLLVAVGIGERVRVGGGDLVGFAVGVDECRFLVGVTEIFAKEFPSTDFRVGIDRYEKRTRKKQALATAIPIRNNILLRVGCVFLGSILIEKADLFDGMF